MSERIKKMNTKIGDYTKTFDEFLHKLDKILL